MRHFLLLCFFVCGLFLCQAQMQINEADSIAIAKVMKKQESAWNQGDIHSFMEGYLKSPKIVFSGAGGPHYGWQNIKERYLTSYANKTQMGQLTFTLLSMQQWTPNFVMMEGKYHLKRTIGDASGYFSLAWLKKNEQWYMINDHTSASKQEL